MNENKWDFNKLVGTIFSQLVEERVKREIIADVLIEKGITSEEELDELFKIKFEEKSEEYSAEALDMTLEEYKNLIE